MNRREFSEIMKGVRPYNLFFNIDTHRLDTYENLTSWESDCSETMLNMDQAEFEKKQQEAMDYFEDLVRDEILIRVQE